MGLSGVTTDRSKSVEGNGPRLTPAHTQLDKTDSFFCRDLIFSQLRNSSPPKQDPFFEVDKIVPNWRHSYKPGQTKQANSVPLQCHNFSCTMLAINNL